MAKGQPANVVEQPPIFEEAIRTNGSRVLTIRIRTNAKWGLFAAFVASQILPFKWTKVFFSMQYGGVAGVRNIKTKYFAKWKAARHGGNVSIIKF